MATPMAADYIITFTITCRFFHLTFGAFPRGEGEADLSKQAVIDRHGANMHFAAFNKTNSEYRAARHNETWKQLEPTGNQEHEGYRAAHNYDGESQHKQNNK